MKMIHANITNYLDKVPNLQDILPKESAVVTGWKNQGILAHMFLKSDRSGAILVFNNIDETRAKELVKTLPLFQYFDKVEYSILDKQF